MSRNRDLNDERVVRIELTAAGVNLRAEAQKVPEAMLCNSGLSKQQFGDIYTELETVLKKIPGLCSK